MKLRAEITPHSGKKTPENDLFFKFFWTIFPSYQTHQIVNPEREKQKKALHMILFSSPHPSDDFVESSLWTHSLLSYA